MTTQQERAALAELAEVERKHKPVRTAAQALAGASAVTIVEYALAYFNADLDPRDAGSQDSFPPVFTGALFTVFAYLSALWMNRKPASDPDAGQSVLVTVLIAAAVCLVLLLAFDVIRVR